MVATGETVGLVEWIIDDTCLVYDISELVKNKMLYCSICK